MVKATFLPIIGVRTLMVIAVTLISLLSFAQENSPYKPYETNRLSPRLTYWHEFGPSIQFTTDLDFEWDGDYDTTGFFSDLPAEGNAGLGMNYGIGAGYLFKIQIDDFPQNAAIGMRAEYYPKRYSKLNMVVVVDWLALGVQERYVSIIAGGELSLSRRADGEEYAMYSLMHLLRARYKQYEFLWALQTDHTKWMEASRMDEAFNVFRLSYLISK